MYIDKDISPISWAIIINNFFISFAVTFINPYFIISMDNDFKINPASSSAIILIGIIIGNLLSYLATIKSKNIISTAFNAHFLLTITFGIFAIVYNINFHVFKLFLVCFIYSSYRLGLMLATNCNRILHLNVNNSSSLNKVFATRNTFAAFGSIMGPIIAGQIYTQYGYMPLIVVTTVLFAITTFVYGWIRTKYSHMSILSNKDDESQNEDKKFNKDKKNRGVLSTEMWVIISFTFVGIFSGQIFSYVPLVLQGSYRDYGKLISLLYSINGFILVIGSVPINDFLSRYFNAEKRYFISIGLYGLGYILFSILPSNLIIFYLFCISTSLAELLFTVANMEIIRSLNENAKKINHAVSKYNLINSIAGVGLGQYLGTMIFQSSLKKWSFIFWILLGIVSCIIYIIGKRRVLYGERVISSTKYN